MKNFKEWVIRPLDSMVAVQAGFALCGAGFGVLFCYPQSEYLPIPLRMLLLLLGGLAASTFGTKYNTWLSDFGSKAKEAVVRRKRNKLLGLALVALLLALFLVVIGRPVQDVQLKTVLFVAVIWAFANVLLGLSGTCSLYQQRVDGEGQETRRQRLVEESDESGECFG